MSAQLFSLYLFKIILNALKPVCSQQLLSALVKRKIVVLIKVDDFLRR
jgi:hypothetical protein